jgi:hypothetical protein
LLFIIQDGLKIGGIARGEGMDLAPDGEPGRQ